MRNFLQHILRSLGIFALSLRIAHFFICCVILVLNNLFLFISDRSAIDVELSKYIGEAYPKGAIYCTSGKDIGADFGLTCIYTISYFG
jgi:hypothetical protein